MNAQKIKFLLSLSSFYQPRRLKTQCLLRLARVAPYDFNVGLFGPVLASAFAVQPELLLSAKGSKAYYEGIVIKQ